MTTATAPSLNARVAAALLPLSPAARADLEASIVREGFRDRIVIWKETGELLDGRHRVEIAAKHGFAQPRATFLSFPDEDAAVTWAVRNQLGRRNLTPLEERYLRGKLQQLSKRDKTENLAGAGNGLESPKPQLEASGKTAAAVAAAAGVSRSTVERDAQLAGAVDKLPPETRRAVLSGESGLRPSHVVEFADGEDLSIEALRRHGEDVRARARARKPDADPGKPFRQKSIREVVPYVDPKDGKEYADYALLACGHRAPYKRRVPVPKNPKTKPCPECGCGTRTAHERRVGEAHLRAALRRAITDPRALDELVGFAKAALLLPSLAVDDARRERVAEDLVVHARKAGLYDRDADGPTGEHGEED